LQIKTKIVSCHTADSKPVKQKDNGTVILPPLVFSALLVVTDTLAISNYGGRQFYSTGPKSDSNLVKIYILESFRWRHNNQHNDKEHNDIEHNDIEHNDTQHKMTFSIKLDSA